MDSLIQNENPATLTNAEILERIISDPLQVQRQHILQLVIAHENLFDALRALIKRIFDINEKTLLEQSDATTGNMGRFNRWSHSARNKRYNKKIKDPAFNRNKGEHKVIVAEGDSWFQFPVFVKDIIDWLGRDNPHFAIYSIAYGGDWLTNMIYEGKYIEELSIHKPDIFLLSAGGNDLVGSNRIALMVDLHAGCPKYNSIDMIPDFPQVDAEDKKDIFDAQDFINKEFYSFLLVLELQYRKIITSIRKKYKDMMIITHGYDFAIPSYRRSFDGRYPLKSFINASIDTGKWLIRPLRIKGIYTPDLQRKIIKAFIFELNLMLNRLDGEYDYFYYVNALKSASHPDDWFDELHLKSHVFKRVAKAFDIAINDHLAKIAGKSTAEVHASAPVKPTGPPPPLHSEKKYVVNELVKQSGTEE